MDSDSYEIVDRATAPTVHDIGEMSLPEDKTTILDNGITLHSLSGGSTEVCRINVILPGGVAESPKPLLYSIANSLLLEGTDKHTGEELSDILEYNGAWTGIDTYTHHSSLSLYCTNSSYGKLLSLVKEIICAPTFQNEAVENMLRAEAARIEVEQHKVAYQAGCAIRRLIYAPEHPLAKIATPESILSITPMQLHEAHLSRLDPHKIHVYLSGKLHDDLIDATCDIFSGIEERQPFPLPQLQFPTHAHGARVHTEMPDALQSCVRIMIPAIGRTNPDFVPLRMAIIALGGYFGSRLMLNIREEKGLTYGISASLLGYKHSGYISISSQTDPSTVNLLIDETIKEMERMKDPSSYTPDEITRLSRYVLSELAGVLDTPFSRMDFIQAQVTANTHPDYFAMQEHTARSLTPELLAGMAERYFDMSRLFISTAGKSHSEA